MFGLLTRSRYASNVGAMAASVGLAQALLVVSTPVLTRTYGPEHFATLVLFTTLQALTLSVATARIEWSLPNLRQSQGAAAVLVLAAIMLTLSIGGLALALTNEAVLAWLGQTTGLSELLVWLLLGSMVATGLQQIAHGWFVFQGRLVPVGLAKIAQAVIFVGASLLAPGFGLAEVGLPAAYAISQIGAAVIVALHLRRLPRVLTKLTRARVLRIGWHFRRDFGSSVLSSAVISAFFYMPVGLIWIYFDEPEMGWYALVLRIGYAPVNILVQTLAKAFWAEAADQVRKDPKGLHRFFHSKLRLLAAIGVPLAFLSLGAPLYFGPVFGADWAKAGWLMAAMTPMFFTAFVFSSSNHLKVYRKQHWQFFADSAAMVAATAVFALLAQAGVGVAGSMFGFALAYAVGFIARFWLHELANRQLVGRLAAEGSMT